MRTIAITALQIRICACLDTLSGQGYDVLVEGKALCRGHSREDTAMICRLANLNKESLDAVRTLEKKMGTTLLAYSCEEASFETLNDEKLAQLKEEEQKLGVSLVALEPLK
jgi:hypothetical protein